MLNNLGKKQKTELIITAIGIIFLTVLFIGRFNQPNKKNAPLIQENAPQRGTCSGQNETSSPLVKDTWGRDPFFFDTAISGEAQNLSEFVLNGIMWDKDNPYAIVNNEVVKLGDKVGSKTVVEINEKSVVLEQDGERYTLELNAL